MNAREEHIGSSDPATKGDVEQLREDLQADMTMMLQQQTEEMEEQFASKSDLKKQTDELKQHFVSKSDLKKHTKEMKEQFASKSDLKKQTEEILRHFDAAVEDIEHNTAAQLEGHEHRIQKLERRVGVSTN